MGRELTDVAADSEEVGESSFDDLHSAVLSWIAPRLRPLPWRSVRDPWLVLVSEVMSQQTGVARVVPKWERFVSEYPTPADCARAPLGDVLRLWQGLGYPRRARNLQHASQVIVESHDGVVPDDLAALLALPGVGPYTARAVLAFAFERDTAVVDTNIARVLARRLGSRLTAREAQAEADRLVPVGEAWIWNQALMDLGASVCRPTPDCGACPLADSCAWHGEGADPSIGSAGVSARQARYEGSDRQARGRLLRRLGDGDIDVDEVAVVMERDHGTAERLVRDLVAEGLIRRRGDRLLL
jgi:A/G-specific adenine glycosylase